MSLRPLLPLAALALAAAAPRPALAQFAGVITPPPRREATVALTPEQQQVQRDSVRREALSDMRAWVDSAAGIVTVTPAAPDAPGNDPTSRPDSTRREPAAPPPRPPRR